MQVPMGEGGALEFAQVAQRLEREFYFSYRFFQAMSNELVTPKVLRCLADTRSAASSWVAFSNSSLSYFVGVNADLSKPNTILAGDRNITNDWVGASSVMRLGPNDTLRWTAELHQFKGNVLFADGRVEEWNTPGLNAARVQVPLAARLVVPSVNEPGSMRQPAESLGIASTSSGRTGGVRPVLSNAPAVRGTNALVVPERSIATSGSIAQSPAAQPGTEATPSGGETNMARALSNPPANPAQPGGGSPGSTGLAEPGKLPGMMALELLRDMMWWFYLLLLLLVLGALVLRRYTRRGKRLTAKE
jgi:prepilin-type processing-associated H-X9-DG protein